MQPTPLRLREVCPCNLLMAEAMTIFCFSLLFFCSHALVSAGSSNATTEELALLAFKSMLSSPSKSLLASWNTSSHYCSWTGVVCSRRQPERVVSLLMGSFNLSGRLSPFLGNLSFLRKLDLHGNQFVGQIPPELGQLSRLQMLNLRTNTLHGSIPEAMGGCTNLTTLDLSNNLLQALVILSLLYILLTWRKRTKTRTPSTTLAQGHPLISYFRLVKATDGFSPTNLLGSGSFGSVYKGELDGQDAESKDLVVVKVLKLQNPRALKSFIAECEALRNMRHRNLVKIITACASIDARGDDFKAIVYDFMPNGSLDGWIHADANEQTRERSLGLSERVTILLDVAYALNYLHCDGPTPVIHCDLKPSNVLLDADMVAHVGDFGLAKIIVDGGSVVQQSASSMGFRGTIGYAAPEYGAGNVVSTNGDIYSYGILVLEMVTARRPTDATFREGLSLREYVELALLHNGTMDIIDMRLSLSLKNDELQGAGEGDSPHKRNTDCLIALLRLGLSCSEELPFSRMPTGDIIKELLRIKGSLM